MLGSGYDTIEDVLNNHLVLGVVLLVLFLKAFVVLLSLGSGTSGGTLAPMFMISAAIGSSFAMIVDRMIPRAHLSPEAFAVAGMGALLGASSRATFTFMFCAFETTARFPRPAAGAAGLRPRGRSGLHPTAEFDHDAEIRQARHARPWRKRNRSAESRARERIDAQRREIRLRRK